MRPVATIRSSPEDFVVREIPAYTPSGEGEHLFVEITKKDLTTNEAVRRVCAALAVDERGAGYAGMKDRRAVTTQTLSVPFPRARSVEEATKLELEGIVVRGAVRHPHKLKPGHLKGNHFAIVLRDLAPELLPEVVAHLEQARDQGVPNAFGPQRFGRDGDNPERALAWLSGRAAGPKDRRERRLLFSALQSHVFNRVLDLRRELGTWNRPLAGDMMKKTDSGGLFLCEGTVEDQDRAKRGEIAPTGEHPDALRVLFVLPKGGYATTLLSEAVSPNERTVTR